MDTDFYLIITGRKHYNQWSISSIDTRKTKPSLAANQIAVKVSLSLPGGIFERPDYQARITVPSDGFDRPVYDAEVADNIAATLSESLGINVTVTAPEQPTESEE